MSLKQYQLLEDQVRLRDWTQKQQEMDEMADLYEGTLPARYEKFFPKSVPKHLVQVIPLAWDDLATSAGRLPDFRGEPRNQTQKESKAVGLLEKIAHAYLRNAKPTGKRFMRDLAWWLQAGRAVAIVTPDWEEKTPRFELRDPRSCYPGPAETVNNSIVKLNDLIFKYELKHSEAVVRGLAPQRDGRGADLSNTMVKVIEYIDSQQWLIVSEHGMGRSADHNLGMVPGWVFETFTPNGTGGRSRFKDQVSLMVAMSRLITAKIAFADRLVHPILWTKGHEASLELGPYVINKLGPSGEMGQITPPTQFQVDRDIQMLSQFSRVLNRNPEVRQGEIAAKGTYTSAKTLEQLSEAIDTVVGGDWDIIGPGLEHLMKVAFTMDVELWPDEEKTISGNLKGTRFLDTYTPAKDIGDRRFIRVDYGFGVGGYQGFLMHLQAKEAKTMSRRRAMEAMPGISDVQEEMNLIDLEDMDEAGKALFQQQAATGQMDIVLWAEIAEKMAEEGMPLRKAILEYQERLMEQAQAAQGTDQLALTPPAPEEPMPEELPGIPGAALAGV